MLNDKITSRCNSLGYCFDCHLVYHSNGTSAVSHCSSTLEPWLHTCFASAYLAGSVIDSSSFSNTLFVTPAVDESIRAGGWIDDVK